jgi:hypothetical protein
MAAIKSRFLSLVFLTPAPFDAETFVCASIAFAGEAIEEM